MTKEITQRLDWEEVQVHYYIDKTWAILSCYAIDEVEELLNEWLWHIVETVPDISNFPVIVTHRGFIVTGVGYLIDNKTKIKLNLEGINITQHLTYTKEVEDYYMELVSNNAKFHTDWEYLAERGKT